MRYRLIERWIELSSLAGYNVIYKNCFSTRSSVQSGPLTLKHRLSIIRELIIFLI